MKRIQIIRPEVEIEFVKPILGRLYFLFILPQTIKVIKRKVYVGSNLDYKFKDFKAKTIYFIGIPKITFKK